MASSGNDFKYGDLIITCHSCGDVQVVEELVTDGRAIYLFNKYDSHLRLHCPTCEITMEMSLRPSENVEDDVSDELEELYNSEDAKIVQLIPDNEKLPEESTPEKNI